MKNITPRGYQTQTVTNARESIGKGFRKIIVQLATGGGKTVIAMMMIFGSLAKNKRVVFLAPRRELIYQAHKVFSANGIAAGMIMAGERIWPSRCQVCSFDTLHHRCMKKGIDLPEADLVIVDEAHLSTSESRIAILESYHKGGAIILGLTATPARAGGLGLGIFYDDLCLSPLSVKEMTEQGYLCPVKYYAADEPDLSGVSIGKTSGDYNEKQLAKVMDDPKLIGGIVHNWKRLADGMQTVVFCVNKAHSRHVCEEFLAAGIPAEHMDSDTETDDRKDILGRVSSGETMVLCNVYIASYGLDIPSLQVAVVAQPTKSLVRYMQTVGRVLRPHDSKDLAYVIDHAGVVMEHGFVDDEMPWTLDAEVSITDLKKKKDGENKEPAEIKCGDCGHVFKAQRKCPMCDHESVPRGADIPVKEANLVEIVRTEDADSKAWNKKTPVDEKAAFYGMMKAWCESKGMKSGAAAHKYRERTGVWPNLPEIKNHPEIAPDANFKKYIQHLNIRKAKSNYSGARS